MNLTTSTRYRASSRVTLTALVILISSIVFSVNSRAEGSFIGKYVSTDKLLLFRIETTHNGLTKAIFRTPFNTSCTHGRGRVMLMQAGHAGGTDAGVKNMTSLLLSAFQANKPVSFDYRRENKKCYARGVTIHNN